MSKDVSIECAQPYNDESRTHEPFAIALGGLLREIHELGQSASVVALVDDTSYEDKAFDFDRYARWLHKNGFKPDLVARESQIASACDEVLRVVDFRKIKPAVTVLLHAERPYSSQLFIASWCLLRLGYVRAAVFNPVLQAERLVNILPASFKPGEDDSLDIIRATPFSEAVDRIDYRFIDELAAR